MANEKINLDDLDKAEVLAVLYNNSKPLGLGFMRYDPKPMTREEAQALLDGGQTYFDYLNGRVMKIDLSGSDLNPWLYDRDNGLGAAERAISALRSTNQTNPELVQTTHDRNTRSSAEELRSHPYEREPSYQASDKIHGFVVYHLSPSDLVNPDVLEQKVDEAIKKLGPPKK